MLKVNLRDGRTLTFDLQVDEQRQAWEGHQADLSFQAQITGVGIQHEGTLHAFPMPVGFHSRAFEVELLYRQNGDGPRVAAERLICYADAVRFEVTVHHGNRPKVVKYSGARVGRMRYNPAIHGRVVRKEE